MPALPKDWPAVLFTHLAVVACTGVAGWFVHTQASATMPMTDEWLLLAQWLDSGRDTLHWVWAHHSEHRYPLTKLLWLAGLSTGGFRAGQWITVGLLASAAVLLLWAARGLRGRAHPADALLPVLLLNLGHGFNLLMSYQLGWAVFAYGLAGWAWAAGRLGRGGWGWAALAGGYITLVVLSGGFGVLFTPVAVGWAAVTAARDHRPAVRRVLSAFALGWAGYTAWVVLTMPATADDGRPLDHSPIGLLGGTIGWLSVGLGAWPISGHAEPRWLGGGLAVAVLAIAGWCLARTRRWDAGRVAVAAVLAGGLLVAAGTAYKRGGGLAARFVTPSAAVLAGGWLAVAGRRANAPPSWPVAVGGWVLGPAAAGGLYWANVEPGLKEGYYARLVADDLMADVTAGLPPVFLAGKYGGSVPVLLGDLTVDYLHTYRRCGFGPFAGVPDDPPFTLVPVAGVSVPFAFESTGADAAAGAPRGFPLPDPGRPVIGLRVRVDSRSPAGWQRVFVRWRDEAGVDRSAWAYPPWVGNRMHLTFPVAGRPTGARFVADGIVQPLTVEAVEWMVPE